MPQATRVIKRRATATGQDARPAVPSRFVQLVVPDVEEEPHAAPSEIEIVLRAGHRLRLSGRIDSDAVARLVRVLEAC